MKNIEFKHTNQRIEILDFLRNNYNHPSVEEVFEGVRKKLKSISKATVYQNLKFLSERGLIQEVNIKGVSRFEPKSNSHQHIICRKCGKIVDFESKELTNYLLKALKDMREFDVVYTNTSFYGICKKCRGHI